MNITIVGSGYVGLVSGACFSEFGFNVTCVDKDSKKIKNLKKGIIPIYEPRLEDLVKSNLSSKRLSFTNNLEDSFQGSDAILTGSTGLPSWVPFLIYLICVLPLSVKAGLKTVALSLSSRIAEIFARWRQKLFFIS